MGHNFNCKPHSSLQYLHTLHDKYWHIDLKVTYWLDFNALSTRIQRNVKCTEQNAMCLNIYDKLKYCKRYGIKADSHLNFRVYKIIICIHFAIITESYNAQIKTNISNETLNVCCIPKICTHFSAKSHVSFAKGQKSSRNVYCADKMLLLPGKSIHLIMVVCCFGISLEVLEKSVLFSKFLINEWLCLSRIDTNEKENS